MIVATLLTLVLYYIFFEKKAFWEMQNICQGTATYESKSELSSYEAP